MQHILVEIMSSLTQLSAEEKTEIETSFPIGTFQKGAFLLKEGQVAQEGFFVINGCVREYELINGEEKTLEFYIENDSVVNFNSMANKTASKQNFICNEETTVAILNEQKEKELYKKFPRFESFCREGMEKMLGKNHNKLIETITLSPEERYLKLQKERSALLNRVPQYQIASYLNIKPETLSRIRKRLVNKT